MSVCAPGAADEEAMVAMTALRFAKESRRLDTENRPLGYYIEQAFELLNKPA